MPDPASPRLKQFSDGLQDAGLPHVVDVAAVREDLRKRAASSSKQAPSALAIALAICSQPLCRPATDFSGHLVERQPGAGRR